jgi:hypothetical protein
MLDTVTTLVLQLNNISSMPYGDGMDSGGFLEVRVSHLGLVWSKSWSESTPPQLVCNEKGWF